MPAVTESPGNGEIQPQHNSESEFRPFMDEWEIAAITTAFSLSATPVSVLEWGSGNSTLYFSTGLPPVSQWDSIEHNRDWALQVTRTLHRLGREDIRLHYIPNSGVFRDGIDDGDYTSFKEYILFPAALKKKFDYVLVDGRARVECMLMGWEILKSNGLMILHDAEREEYNPGIPESAHQLRMTNPFLPEGKSVLFLARDTELLAELARRLDALLPETILLASDIADSRITLRSARAMMRYGQHLHAAGDVQVALAVLEQAIDLAPDLVEAYNALGLILAQLDRSDGALMAFKMVREIEPSNSQAVMNAVHLLLTQGQMDDAVAWLENFLLTNQDESLSSVLQQLLEVKTGPAELPPATLEALSAGPVSQVFSPQASPVRSEPLCIFVNTYYAKFLDSHYRSSPALADSPYEVQRAALQASRFGDSNFYSDGLRHSGWMAEDLIVNCDTLQQAWAREHGVTAEGLAIAVEQIRRARPEVVYLQDLALAIPEFIHAIRPWVRLVVGQIASPLPPQTDLSLVDILFSSFPHFVDRFRSLGRTAYYQPLAFSPDVLDALADSERDIPVSFVGGISPAHAEGLKFLEYLAGTVDIDFWGYGREHLAPDSALFARHHGEAWGLQMFGLLRRSRITVNRHIDVALHSANNMRLFEATGCGALLITDYKDNLSDLFEIGREVVAYRDPEECAELIRYYQAHPEEAAEIARAGQARTLRDHSYAGNMRQTAMLLARHLRYQQEGSAFTSSEMAQVAGAKSRIEKDQVTDTLRTGWQSASIPARQRALVQHELAEMYAGRVPQVYQIAAAALYSLVDSGDRILELGCASGYYSEVFEYLLNCRIDYIGVDYSAALIAQARDYYPHARFEVADVTALPFADQSVKLAFSSAVLMHVENYPAHLDELMRVASDHVVLHRTPVYASQPTRIFSKKAYGVEVVELCFNQAELIERFSSSGWRMVSVYQLAANPGADEYEMTYVFSRM